MRVYKTMLFHLCIYVCEHTDSIMGNARYFIILFHPTKSIIRLKESNEVVRQLNNMVLKLFYSVLVFSQLA